MTKLTIFAAHAAVLLAAGFAHADDSAMLDYKNDPDRVVCKQVNRKGSYIKTRVCARQAEWAENRWRSLKTLDRLRQLESHRPMSPDQWAMGQ